MSLSCHSPSWQWLPECCWQQTRQIRSDGAGSGSERFVLKSGMSGRLPWTQLTCSVYFCGRDDDIFRSNHRDVGYGS